MVSGLIPPRKLPSSSALPNRYFRSHSPHRLSALVESILTKNL